MKGAQNMSHGMWSVRQSQLWNKDACKLNACAPRDRRSSVRQRRHWCCAWWAACCARRSSFCLRCCSSSPCILIAVYRTPLFSRSHFSVFGGIVFTLKEHTHSFCFRCNYLFLHVDAVRKMPVKTCLISAALFLSYFETMRFFSRSCVAGSCLFTISILGFPLIVIRIPGCASRGW